jgi:hypothetical protein
MKVDEYLYFVDRSLDGMSSIVGGLGDDLANSTPTLDGANSPYVILNHCLGVIEHWVGARMVGRPDRRDRPAEFGVAGPVAPLLHRVAEARSQLSADLGGFAGDVPARTQPDRRFRPEAATLSETGVLLHVLQELAQHHGQMEITRDLLTARGHVAGS